MNVVSHTPAVRAIIFGYGHGERCRCVDKPSAIASALQDVTQSDTRVSATACASSAGQAGAVIFAEDTKRGQPLAPFKQMQQAVTWPKVLQC